jgi:DNA (cytosine-5)-methyltransferase 1
MKVLSLFSGVGGFDMGLENAGMQTVFQCEWDKHANTILNKHWPHVPKWEDVSKLTGKHILTHAPVIDVVAWGSPCQDLSVAGKRGGLEGERSGLFHEGIRIIKELRKETNGQYPRISIWENVVGALNSNRGADFGIILNEMAEAGALVIEWAVLDAQYFGVPQRRRRVFVVAIFDPVLAERCPETLLPVAESLPGHLAKGKPARKSTTSKTPTSVGADGGILGSDIVGSLNTSDAKMISSQYVNENKCVVEPVAYHFDALSSNSMKSSNPDSGVNKVDQARTLDTWRPDPSLNQGGLAIVEELMLIDGTRVNDVRIYEEPVQTLKERMGTGGNNVPMLAFDTQFGSNANVTENVAPTLKSSQAPPSVAYPIQDGRDIDKHQNGLGVADASAPAYTLDQTGSQAVAYSIREDAKAGNFSATELDHANSLSALQPSPQSHHAQMFIAEPTMAVRRLTPLECERLMGWPDDHTRYKADGTEQADTHRYKQCGNGVASPVAQWIAKHLLKLEEQQ